MKIALINAAEVERSPYLKTYQEYLDEKRVKYTIIEWRRDLEYKNNDGNIISFNYHSSIAKNRFLKFYDYRRFASFVKGILASKEYDKLIVFDYQIAFFLSNVLRRKFNKKYLVDIRDWNRVIPFIKRTIKRIDECAFGRVISSPGYDEWLFPVDREAICHNTTEAMLLDIIDSKPINSTSLPILTLGSLRNYVVDEKIVKVLSKDDKYRFVFAGGGRDAEMYNAFSIRNKLVSYLGPYKKTEEKSIASIASFINIFWGVDSMIYNTAMSNRFYLSICYGIPMIVNSQNIQSKFVEKYHLGVVASSVEELPSKVSGYIRHFNIDEYNAGRQAMIDIVKSDFSRFKQLLNDFINL